MSPSLYPTLTLVSLALVVCSLFHAASAVPGPNPSVIYGADGNWICPPADGLEHALIGQSVQDMSFTCIYAPYYNGIQSDCQYRIDNGGTWQWDAEDACPDHADPAPQRKKREDNFTAMEKKVKARAALPQATVPQYMHTRRHVRRLRSGSAPHHGW